MKEVVIAYIEQHIQEIFYALFFAIVIGILIALIIYFYQRHKDKEVKLKKYYDFIWKKSSFIKPADLLQNRPFKEYYRRRKEDDLIEDKLHKRQNILIKGPPLSGKSRAVYQALVKLRNPCNVIKPRCTDINPEDFVLPGCLLSKRPRIMIIDDLQRFVEQRNFEHLLQISEENGISILATCRSEADYEKIANKMQSLNIDLQTIFSTENIIELGKVSENIGKEVALKTGITWRDVKFDGNIGSVFMRLGEMQRRFNEECGDIEKNILLALRQLYICGVYEGRQVFPLKWIQIVTGKKGLKGEEFEWIGWLNKLKSHEFIAITGHDRVCAEEVYLEDVVKPQALIPDLTLFIEMIPAFAGEPEALVRLGIRAWDVGSVSIEKANYMKIAIEAFENALISYHEKNSSIDYAAAQNNLGNAYRTLGEVEQKALNCKMAIKAFQEALKVYTIDAFPLHYTMTQNNLGIAYRTLGEVEQKALNCKMGIKAYEEALKVRTIDAFPLHYATTQNNLGNAYRTLGEVEQKALNCKIAIKAFQEALKVYTIDAFPLHYTMTQNNLGTAYGTLGEVEQKALNCKMAIKAFQEALQVYTIDAFPMDYAMTQNNLGNAYRTLGEVEQKALNCKMAIKAFQEALQVYTIDAFPMHYALTQNNLGNAYHILGEVEQKAQNSKMAIKAYEEALKVRTIAAFPMQYAMTQNNLGNAYDTLGEVEQKALNCKMAIKAYEEALKVYTIDAFPMDYAKTQNNLGTAYGTLGEVEQKALNCKMAIKAYEEALKVFSEKEFPETYTVVSSNLRKALDFYTGAG